LGSSSGGRQSTERRREDRDPPLMKTLRLTAKGFREVNGLRKEPRADKSRHGKKKLRGEARQPIIIHKNRQTGRLREKGEARWLLIGNLVICMSSSGGKQDIRNKPKRPETLGSKKPIQNANSAIRRYGISKCQGGDWGKKMGEVQEYLNISS